MLTERCCSMSPFLGGGGGGGGRVQGRAESKGAVAGQPANSILLMQCSGEGEREMLQQACTPRRVRGEEEKGKEDWGVCRPASRKGTQSTGAKQGEGETKMLQRLGEGGGGEGKEDWYVCRPASRKDTQSHWCNAGGGRNKDAAAPTGQACKRWRQPPPGQ